MATIVSPNPVINEGYFKNQDKAKKLAEALLEQYDVGHYLPENFGEDGRFDDAHPSEIEELIRNILNEDLP